MIPGDGLALPLSSLSLSVEAGWVVGGDLVINESLVLFTETASPHLN